MYASIPTAHIHARVHKKKIHKQKHEVQTKNGMAYYSKIVVHTRIVTITLKQQELTKMMVDPRSSTMVQLWLLSPRVATGRVLTKTLPAIQVNISV